MRQNISRMRPPPRRLALVTAATMGGMLLAALPARAVPFASFSDHGNTAAVVFTNHSSPGYSTNSTLTVTNELVDFTFQGFANLPAALLSTQSAHLSYSVTTTDAATTSSHFDAQTISNAFTMSFVRTTPFTPAGNPSLHLSNLLTVMMTPMTLGGEAAELSGRAGSQEVDLNADDGFEVVTFSSDFLDFSGSAEHSAALSYTLQTLQFLGIGTKFLTAYDKMVGNTSAPTCGGTITASSQLCNYRGFRGTESGNFGATPLPTPIYTVPEPASGALLGMGIFGLVAIRRFRKVA